MIARRILSILVFSLFTCVAFSQKVTRDTLSVTADGTPEDTFKKVAIVVKDTAFHNPRIATRRSALLPGWGQAYNKEYWKLPLVYAAIGIPAGLFVYNDIWYKKTKKAYEIRLDNDSLRFKEIDKKLLNDRGEPLAAESMRFYRNEFRKSRDYSILYFFIAWGLNVVDATVFAHLKQFDVSPDLSMQVRPTYNPTIKATGFSLVLATKNPIKKAFLVTP